MKSVSPIKARISAQGGVTRVDVYDDIGEGGWFSEGLTAKSFTNQLASVTGPLEVHINSGGGDVWDGISIKNAIETHKGPVTTVVDGIAASIASVIAQAGSDRVMMPGSMMMIHEAFTVAAGDSAELAKTAQTLDEVSANLAAIYARSAGGTAEDWRAAMKQETWYTAEQAVDVGLADRTGDGSAVLPTGLDLAAFAGSVPGRIAAQLQTMPRAVGPRMANVLRQFDEGDLVQVIGQPHEPGHSQGRVAVVNGNAYGICFDSPDDDTMPGEPYLWYVDNELEFVAEGPDREGEGYGQEEAEPEPEPEPLMPGVSHPMGRPAPTGRTRTVINTASPTHHTAVQEGTWDKGVNVGRLPSPMPVATAKNVYAVYDEDRTDSGNLPKDAGHLPHHFVSADGTPGAASANGVRSALSSLPKTQGLSAEERAAAERHLQAHLDDAHQGDEGGTSNHAEDLPGWLTNNAPPLPAWLNPAKEATQ